MELLRKLSTGKASGMDGLRALKVPESYFNLYFYWKIHSLCQKNDISNKIQH